MTHTGAQVLETDISFQQLRALLTVSRTGSITSAALALKVTQPVLTRSIRQLERQLGVGLLHRSPRGATLTPYGEALVRRGRLIEEEVRRSLDELKQMQGIATGLLRVACSPVSMLLFVPQAMAQFRRSFPGVEVRATELVYPQVTDALREDRIDFAVGPVPAGGLGRDYKADHLLTVRMAVALRRGHPRAGATSLSDLQDEEWVVMGPHGGPGAIVEPSFARHGLPVPRCTMYLDTVWSALEVLKRTDLIGFVPEPIAAAAEPALQVVRITQDITPLEISTMMRAQAVLTPAGRALMSAMRAAAAQWRPRG